MKYRKAIIFFLCFILLFSIIIPSFADDDNNADSGGGEAGGATKGKGYYRSGEWMYKVSVYVGISDKSDTRISLPYGYRMIGDEPIFVKPSNFTLPDGVIFAKNSKVDYRRGIGLSLSYADQVKIVTDNPPAIPITHGGRLKEVKNYFGDTLTLKMLLTGFAEQKGTTREGLVRNMEFTIDGKKGKQNPKDILPIKVDGSYQNKVPWVIIYEPVVIAHLKDGNTKLAFTATEYAIAQKEGLFNFFHSGSEAQDIASMTHANLPNSIVLEKDWLGYEHYSPLPAKQKWDSDRIIYGGGWGMRWLAPNSRNIEEPIEPPNEDGDYRVNTDVITSFRVRAGDEINPNRSAYATFRVNGKVVGRHSFVSPSGGSQLVWTKWRTPEEPGTVEITAEIGGNGDASFERGNRTISKVVKIVDLNQNVPLDPRAMDYNTGKAIEKPRGWRVPKLPRKARNTSASWGEWSAYWVPPEDEDDEGYWDFFWNTWAVDLDAKLKIQPDEKVPTAKQYFQNWEMKSGYGLNIEVDTEVSHYSLDEDGARNSKDVTRAQNCVNYFPEFHYETYWRLSERTKRTGGSRLYKTKFELQKNKYSPNEQRVHYTPLWFPDNEKYTPYVEVIDVWTPSGMLSTGLTDYIEIKGNIFDDWTIVPARIN